MVVNTVVLSFDDEKEFSWFERFLGEDFIGVELYEENKEELWQEWQISRKLDSFARVLKEAEEGYKIYLKCEEEEEE